MQFFIYKITNKINGKCYIGQTIDPARRWNQHKTSKRKYAVYNAMNKYGKDNFTFEVIDTCDNQYETDIQEIYFIKIYCSTDIKFGYNLALGGNIKTMLGYKHSKETKKKISEKTKGRHYSPKTQFKKGQFAGDKHPNYGKKLSEESLKKRAKARKGKYCGANGSNAKLTESQRIEVYNLYQTNNYTQQQLGKLFNIDQSTVSDIIKAVKKSL